MEIGRIPSIAPDTATNQNTGGSSQQAQSDLPEFQIVTPAARTDSAQLTFREITVRTPQRNEDEAAQNGDAEAQADELASDARQERRDREVRREIELDRDTAAVVFRAIEVSTGDVVRQYPEEARLNLRAYLAGEAEARAERAAVDDSE